MSTSTQGPTSSSSGRQGLAELEPPMSRKRKERGAGGFGFFDVQPPPRRTAIARTTTKAEPEADRKPPPPMTATAALPLTPKPTPRLQADNRLLAGYLAHEFLTRGTLCGKRWDPAAAAARAILSRAPEGAQQRPLPVKEMSQKQPASAGKPMGYAEVAGLLKGENGDHIPGVVNPTQLGRWLQM